MGWTTQRAWNTSDIQQRRLEALRLLRQVPAIAQLALLDASGPELIATLRSAFGREIAAFLISGDTSPDRMREVRSTGLHLLRKPVTPMALRAMLVRHLKMGTVSIAPDIGSQQLTA